MTKRLSSKFKVYKQFGVQLWEKYKVIPPKKRTKGAKPNLVENANKYAGIHGYAVKWTEKQIFKKFYGNISEKQLKKYVTRSKATKDPMSTFIQLVESRLDVILYRMFFADTLFSARQLINHGHITVNSSIVTKPSYIVKMGDIITPTLGLGKFQPLSATINSSKPVPLSAARSALLIFENIVRRLVLIFKLDSKSTRIDSSALFISDVFNLNFKIQGQAKSKKINSNIQEATPDLKQVSPNNSLGGLEAGQGELDGAFYEPSAIKRNSKIIKYLKLLKLGCLGASKGTANARKKLNQPITVNRSRQTQSMQDRTQGAGTTVTYAIGARVLRNNSQSIFESILKSLDSTKITRTQGNAAHQKEESTQLYHINRTSAASATNQAWSTTYAMPPAALTLPYMKINYALLTGIYLRHPEIAEISYPQKLKLNLNRIINYYK